MLCPGVNHLDDVATDIAGILELLSAPRQNLFQKLSVLPSLAKYAGYMPVHSGKKAACQEVIELDPDLTSCLSLKPGLFHGGASAGPLWFILYILKPEIEMLVCTGCRFSIVKQQECTGTATKPELPIMRNIKKPVHACLLQLLWEETRFLPIALQLLCPISWMNISSRDF